VTLNGPYSRLTARGVCTDQVDVGTTSFLTPTVDALVAEAQALAAAQALAVSRGRVGAAALLEESRRLVLGRLLRGHASRVSLDGDQVLVDCGSVGTLSAEAALAMRIHGRTSR
jgi:hypothetical protein